jgi:capsular exopolysaccharide synthesis family protein
MMTPVYTAEATLLIERNAPRVLDIHEVNLEPQVVDEYDFYKTQYEILKSRTLAVWVIQEQALESNDLFAGKKEGYVATLWSIVKGWVTKQEWASRFFPRPLEASGEAPLRVKPTIIDTYMSIMEIKPIQHTRLVKIITKTSDPALSARLANAHAQAYIRQGLELRTKANEEAQHFLQEKLVELKNRLEQSEATLKDYRRGTKIVSLDDKENMMVERLSNLHKRLSEAEADRIGLEAQLHVIRKRDYENSTAISTAPVVQTLKQQLAQREAEAVQLSSAFQPGHPRLATIKAQIEETRRQLREEIQKVVMGVEAAYLSAMVRERALRDKIEEQKMESLSMKDAAVQYTILAREVDTNRQLYDSVLQRMKETGVAAELRASNVSIIDYAQPPPTPSKSLKKNLLLSALMGLIGGVGLGLVLECLDNTLKTPEEVERYLCLPPLGVVPDFLNLNGRTHAPRKPHTLPQRLRSQAYSNEYTLVSSHHPRAVVTETYRTLRAAILLSRAAEPPKTILFTSSIHREGKTVTVINTAIVFAQMGVRVLVIDADLRHPDCHRVLGIENGVSLTAYMAGLGLTEVLTGQRMPEEVIRPTVLPHLFLLSAGSSPPDPAELVGSRKMQEFLASLQEHYDYILIDSPPVMPVSDAVLLSTIVDGVVLVVNTQETSKYVVKGARTRLSYARAKILGVVLNRVNLQSGDYVYYQGPYPYSDT